MLLDAGGNHEMTGSLDILGNLTVNQGIYHRGDTDTSIGFANNNFHIKVGNEINFNVVPSQVTVGDGGNVDFQVKALGDQYNLFSDGGECKSRYRNKFTWRKIRSSRKHKCKWGINSKHNYRNNKWGIFLNVYN